MAAKRKRTARSRPKGATSGGAKRAPSRARRSIADLVKATGYGDTTVRRWLAAGWDGDPATVEEWRAANLGTPGRRPLYPSQEQAKRPAPADGPDWTNEFRRGKALLAMLEVRKRRGELVERKEIETMMVQRIAEVRAGLLRLEFVISQRAAMQPADRVAEIVAGACRDLLEQFARGVPVQADQVEDAS